MPTGVIAITAVLNFVSAGALPADLPDHHEYRHAGSDGIHMNADRSPLFVSTGTLYWNTAAEVDAARKAMMASTLLILRTKRPLGSISISSHVFTVHLRSQSNGSRGLAQIIAPQRDSLSLRAFDA